MVGLDITQRFDFFFLFFFFFLPQSERCKEALLVCHSALLRLLRCFPVVSVVLWPSPHRSKVRPCCKKPSKSI